MASRHGDGHHHGGLVSLCVSAAQVVGDDAPASKPRPTKRPKKASSDGDGDDDEDEGSGKKRKGTGYGKPLPLSDALAAACGKPEMTRGELVKWVYAYVKEHDLKVRIKTRDIQ